MSRGFLTPFVGLRYFFENKTVRGWMVAPFLLGILFGVFALAGSIWLALHFSYFGAQAPLPEWVQLLPDWSSRFLIFLLALVGIFLGFYLFFRVLMAPFLSKVAEKVFLHRKVPVPGAQQMLKMFFISVLRSIALGCLSLPLFVFLIVPGLNLFAAMGFALLIATDIVDFSLEARGLNLTQRFKFVRDNLWSIFGLAISQSLLGSIPGLALLVLPFSVAGSADLVCSILERTRNESGS